MAREWTVTIQAKADNAKGQKETLEMSGKITYDEKGAWSIETDGNAATPETLKEFRDGLRKALAMFCPYADAIHFLAAIPDQGGRIERISHGLPGSIDDKRVLADLTMTVNDVTDDLRAARDKALEKSVSKTKN